MNEKLDHLGETYYRVYEMHPKEVQSIEADIDDITEAVQEWEYGADTIKEAVEVIIKEADLADKEKIKHLFELNEDTLIFNCVVYQLADLSDALLHTGIKEDFEDKRCIIANISDFNVEEIIKRFNITIDWTFIAIYRVVHTYINEMECLDEWKEYYYPYYNDNEED